MNEARRRLADALHEADFALEEVAAILSAIELAVLVSEKTETFPYGNPNNPNNARARGVGLILRKYMEVPR